MSYTIIIIAITCIISLIAFSNEALMSRLILWPRKMDNPVEYYRLLTSGFIHADWAHLLFNMWALYVFGTNVQSIFSELNINGDLYVLLYLSAIIISNHYCLPAFFFKEQAQQLLPLTRRFGRRGGNYLFHYLLFTLEQDHDLPYSFWHT
jgi:membrane associated rhomboid family serine protease